MARHAARILPAMALVLFAAASYSFCQEADIAQLVDRYRSDTDIQRSAVEKEYLGKKIAVSGTVANVSDENTFDVVNDVERHYYKVVTDTVNTAKGNPYRTILIYKDINKVKDVNKAQSVSFLGNIIRVADEGLYLSVWLSADDLTDKEKELFK